ncbi:MAG TPA: GNAT family N-acetyltransferase [Luteibaculaceae bacterium]|nr:GNAT family N-acetyltransferase [Luteibaculaceae bacterium]
MIEGNPIVLRAVEPGDVDFLYHLENDRDLWAVSNTRNPYSKRTLEQYAAEHHDIFADKQFRWVISANEKPVGCLDLFEFDPFHSRAGVGIAIDRPYRRNGFAETAIQLIMQRAKSDLGCRLLYANIASDNPTSAALFEKLGFQHIATLPHWHRTEMGKFIDQFLYCAFL